MEDGDWVLVRAPSQKHLWKPSLPNADDLDGDEPSRPLKVTFSSPAKYWTDAIPIGNGRLGAMVWGGVHTDVLQLNGKVKCCFHRENLHSYFGLLLFIIVCMWNLTYKKGIVCVVKIHCEIVN